ncbi:VOC family protein [Elongatibacter sediminis]|uniref:VOC family protein n=1 Tax=Elongatibacter sediminis TaxID=3119006 RepID=A0AAW9R558_9GAMM
MNPSCRATLLIAAILALTACSSGDGAGTPPPVAVSAEDESAAVEPAAAEISPVIVAADHVGLTVPDIEQAVDWFQSVFGCSAALSFGPFSDPEGTFMQDLLGVHPRAVIQQITMLRCGQSANIELLEYESPDPERSYPKNSDWGGHHVAFYVTDIDAAVADLVAKGVEKLHGPLPVNEGPAAGQTINYFRAPFGTYIELISYPEGMAYEQDAEPALWSPKHNGTEASGSAVPGLLGVDHAGITVPDIDVAVAWLEDSLGCSAPLTFGPFSDPEGTFMQDLLGVHPRAVVNRITQVRCGTGASIELMEYEAPDQDQTFRRNSDRGGKHIAFYVSDIEQAVAHLIALGADKLFGPLPVTEGPAAGQTINYVRAPFGTYIELISYPDGMAYEASAQTRLWDPRDNRP